MPLSRPRGQADSFGQRWVARGDVGRRAAPFLLPLSLAACSAGHAPERAEPLPCVVAAGAAAPLLRVALLDRVAAAAAPVPRNPAERLVFAQLYETLVAVDCAGHVRPHVAASWTSQQQGRVWLFELRRDAVYTDGTTIDAPAVLASWSANTARAPAAHALLAAVTATAQHTVRVELHEAAPDPSLFADPAFALSRRSDDATLPAGSAPFAVASFDGARGEIRLAARNGTRTIEFFGVTGADPRRALDAGADLLVTADVATLEYARALPDYSAAPLPWNRTYILATQASGRAPAMPPPDTLSALARDVVRGAARAADSAGLCLPAPTPRAAAATTTPLQIVMYPRADAVARSIAERLIALSWPRSRTPAWLHDLLPPAAATAPVARAVDEAALLTSLRTGEPHVYVVPVSRVAAGNCSAVIAGGEPLFAALANPARHTIPLIDTRDHLIHRPGIGPVSVDGFGTIRFREPPP